MSGMSIGFNSGAMSALSALNSNTNALQSALQQLSTGKRINSAADDASGYAISQKMQSQINGLGQANQNAQDGISLLQTASGALNETNSILQQMRTLSVQAANDTNTSSDTQSIQDEMNQLTSEIDNIASTTQFNTKDLLNGNLGLSTSDATNLTQLGMTNATQSGTATFSAGATATLATAAIGSLDLSGATTTSNNGTLNITVNGQNFNVNFNKGESFSDLANAINSSVSGITATYDSTANAGDGALDFTTNDANSSQSLSVSEATAKSLDGTDDYSTAGAYIDDVKGSDASITGTITGSDNATAAYTISGNQVTLTSGAQQGVTFSLAPDVSGGATATLGNQSINVGGSLTLQIGANQGQTMSININAMDSTSLGVSNLNVTTQSGAQSAINSIDNAITTVSNQQAELGAYQNRLEDTMSNLSTASQNLSSAQSDITDTDMATEMASYTQDNVLQQAAVSMLAQANQQPQLVLKLLQ